LIRSMKARKEQQDNASKFRTKAMRELDELKKARVFTEVGTCMMCMSACMRV
jgi:hypothetical protein